MKTQTLLLTMALLTVLALPTRAQCGPNGGAFVPYGHGCNTVFGTPPSLSGSYDHLTCTASITLTGSPGCCNTYLQSRILALGFSAANVPVPQIGPTCVLYVNPVIFLTLEPGNPTLQVSVPASFIGATLYAQGANVYFTTIGFTTDAELSNGLLITFY